MFKDAPGPALMGSTRHEDGVLRFEPALPLIAGQVYQLLWHDEAGKQVTYTTALEAAQLTRPAVALRPQGVPLPANALKLYLHFSQPMEQGVFLEKLRLTDASGNEIHGPFRETELWSPDGKRLTVWFHPGRQKTGVNLNEDEGPVLIEGGHYTLHVAASWRSVHAVPLGNHESFPLTVGPADHSSPQPAEWKLDLPHSHTLEPLKITFDEPLDTAMLTSALTVRPIGSDADMILHPTVLRTGTHWSAKPDQPWQPGSYELRMDPLLEDLAGNSLVKPFETDVTEPAIPRPQPVISRKFTLP
ncbi:Ig-like domain-containing protein [Prosthecobacter sp. SYSU 5D2]